MKIANTTHWRGDQILAIARRVADHELEPRHRKHYTIRVKYGRRGAGVSGRAPLGGYWCSINVGSDSIDTVNLAHTLGHEMAHSRGVTHAQMRGSTRYTYAAGWRDVYAWAKDLPVERKPVKPKPSPEAKREARLAHLAAQVERWRRREKLARTKLRLWTRRLKAAERRTQAASVPPRVTVG